MRSLAPVLLLLIACGKKSEAPAAGSAAPSPTKTETAPVASTGSGSGSGSAAKVPAAPAKPSATPEQRASYRKHLKAGRTLARAGKWGEAVTELQACLDAMPGDARATGELGWALFNAGDYAKAKVASASAAKQALDVPVKAASLYNLGRVEEALGDKLSAARHYVESLLLRPNKVVQGQLDKLGTDVAAQAKAPPAPPCATPQTEQELCACFKKEAADPEQPDPGACAVDADEIAPGFRIARVSGYMYTETLYLLAKAGDKWTTVAHLEDVYNPGAFGISEELGDIKVTDKTVAGHRVVQVSWSKGRSDSDMGVNEVESEDTESTVFCVVDATATSCPVQVMTYRHFARGPLFDDPKEMGMDDIDPSLKSKPVDDKVRLDATLGDDGVVTVVLAEGKVDEASKAVLGPRKLW